LAASWAGVSIVGFSASRAGPSSRSRAWPERDGAVLASREGKGKMQASEVSRAVAAAKSIVSGLGLTVDNAIVLWNSNKLALRLLPCDVLARVAYVGQEVAQFEV